MLLCRYDGHCTGCLARLVQARRGEPRRNPQPLTYHPVPDIA